MLPAYPANYLGNNGNVPPAFGGAIAELHAAFAFDYVDGDVAISLPAGAQIVGFDVIVNTTFDGSATLSVGHTGSAAYYLSAASILGTAGPTYSTAWLTSGKWFTVLPSPEDITITVGGSPTQ